MPGTTTGTAVLRTNVHKGEKVTSVRDSRKAARDYLASHARTQSAQDMAAEHLRRAEKRLASGQGVSRLVRVAKDAEGVALLFLLSGTSGADFPLVAAKFGIA